MEFIGERVFRGDRALAHARSTVCPRGVALQEAMPVNRRTLFRVAELIGDLNINGIAPVGFNRWTGKGIVDEKHTLVIAIRGQPRPGNGEFIVTSLASIGNRALWPFPACRYVSTTQLLPMLS